MQHYLVQPGSHMAGGGAGDGRPRLVPCQGNLEPSVLIASGFPWYMSAHAAAVQLSTPFGMPKTVRPYEDPVNGSSTGIFFVEYDAQVPLHEVRELLIQSLQHPAATVAVFHMTLPGRKWDRSGGWLPLLPQQQASAMAARHPAAPPPTEAFGPEGFEVRCGAAVGLPNTVLFPAEMAAARKRLRGETAASIDPA